MEGRRTFNLLRLKHLRQESALVPAWKIEDYRKLTLEELFDRLEKKGILLDRISFGPLADDVDTPEALTEELLKESKETQDVQDQIYLLIFELWRRLVPEKMCLSIFCDELDHLIEEYETGTTEFEPIQDILGHLSVILEENTDQGFSPQQVFDLFSQRCAHDVESFLYDFIADQIDSKNDSYALELLDSFAQYVSEPKWFDLLEVRLALDVDPERELELMRKIINEVEKEEDLEFNLEALSSLTKCGDRELFSKLIAHTLPLLTQEDDFQDLLSICAEYLHYLDEDNQENAVKSILSMRSNIPRQIPFNANDPHLVQLVQLVK